jgi:hypothetical protein
VVAGELEGAVMTIETRWVRRRCYVSCTPIVAGATADLRLSPADPASSIARAPRELDEDSTAALVLDEEKLGGVDPEDLEAWAVIVAADGAVLAQQRTGPGE